MTLRRVLLTRGGTYLLQISAYNTAKERLAKRTSNDEARLPTSDIPYLYKDKTVDLETGETKPESERNVNFGNEAAEDKSKVNRDGDSKQSANEKSGDVETALQNENSVSNDGPRSSSPNVESTSENLPGKGICW